VDLQPTGTLRSLYTGHEWNPASEMPPQRQQMLLSWHEEHPPTEWERRRNAAIFTRQGNRNLIDQPALARDLLPALASPEGR
jgi:endonuclease I